MEIGIYLHLPGGYLCERNVHLVLDNLNGLAIRDPEVVELINIGEMVFRGGKFYCTVDNYHILNWENNCVEASCVGKLLNLYVVVNHWGSVVCCQKTKMNVGALFSLRQCLRLR